MQVTTIDIIVNGQYQDPKKILITETGTECSTEVNKICVQFKKGMST